MFLYLAGNIGGLTEDGYTGWRNKASEYLDNCGHTTFDPCRGKDYNEQYGAHEIVERDLSDIDKSDMVLANMDFPGIGTSMEIIYAKYVRHIPVIVVSNSETVRNHYWIRYFATKIFDNLDDALDYIEEFWDF